MTGAFARLGGWLARLLGRRIGVAVRDRAGARGSVRARVFHVHPDGRRELIATHETPNQVVEGFDEQVAAGAAGDGGLDRVTGFKVGTGGTAPAYTNDDINSPVFTADLVSFAANGTALEVTAFLDTTEANGNDLVEGGLVAGSTLYNHATYGTITKTENREVLYDITITQDSETTG